ncbi:MAG: phenylacetate-CoA oxygenase/reductase subunit PaaK [Flavobacteriales bacterium]|nr:phenylacetate-CoA oxygenase/reductase subunit PaaK [Flavobacteriales bacterium]
MSNHFHEVKVQEVRKTTPDCAIVTLDIANGLSEAFAFKQGQYLTIKAEIDGEEVQRSYSLCSCPHEGKWQVGIKKVPGGRFSTFANDTLKPGDTLQVMEPNGRFFVEVDESKARNYVAFAAGSGITPIYSIIKTHLESEPDSTFKLFYVNQTVGSIILREEIEALKNRFMERLEVFHLLTRESRNMPLLDGRLDEEKLAAIFSRITSIEEVDHVFTCGPEEMIFMVKDFLVSEGMDEDRIHFELFNTSGAKYAEKHDYSKELAGLVSKVTILEGGKSFKFDIEQGSNNILDGALQAGADVPFACKGGVCCTCRAKLMEGEVDMQVNYALEADEVEQGFILTCQSIPKSELVVVDFDQ